MRVLHVVEATIAGVRRHVYTLATRLDQQRFEVAVACPPHREQSFGDDRFVADLRQAGVAVIPVAMTRAIRPGADAGALRELARIIRAGGYDVVHTHSSKAGFLGRLAARLAGDAATVYTPSGLYFLGLPPGPKRSFYLNLERLAGLLSDRIVAVSPGERDAIVQAHMAPPERVCCIEPSIDPIPPLPEPERSAVRQELGQTGGGLLVGTVARLAAQKNPALFLDAAALVLRELPETRFVWCGGGELAEMARQRAEALGIAHACRFLGHREDPWRVLAALDLFWLTSDYEGMPSVLLEAMALQVPIVATDVIGSRDLLRGTAGLLVPPGVAPTLAAVTVMLARQPGRRAALAEAGYRRFIEHGTTDQMIRRIERMYDDLMTQAGRRRPTSLTQV